MMCYDPDIGDYETESQAAVNTSRCTVASFLFYGNFNFSDFCWISSVGVTLM